MALANELKAFNASFVSIVCKLKKQRYLDKMWLSVCQVNWWSTQKIHSTPTTSKHSNIPFHIIYHMKYCLSSYYKNIFPLILLLFFCRRREVTFTPSTVYLVLAVFRALHGNALPEWWGQQCLQIRLLERVRPWHVSQRRGKNSNPHDQTGQASKAPFGHPNPKKSPLWTIKFSFMKNFLKCQFRVVIKFFEVNLISMILYKNNMPS